MKIGILGGIGPEATAEFYLKLIFKLQKKGLIRNNESYPQIIINSIPAPELIGDSYDENNLEMYLTGLEQLDSLKPDFIIMVCNTIHLFYDLCKIRIKTPIIDLREEIKNLIFNKKVIVFGTPLAINRLYTFGDKLEKNEINLLSNAIFNFNRGFKKELQIKIVKKLARKYGDYTILLGCTELALMLDGSCFDVINTIDVLVDATITNIYLNNESKVDEQFLERKV